MNIKSQVYETLTPRQRIIAAIEAEARGDKGEMQRLKETCPLKHYKMADAAYTMPMQLLVNISMLVECQIRGELMSFYFALFADKPESEEIIDLTLQNITNIKSAWHATLIDMGIDPNSMAKVGMQPHLLTDFLPTIPDFMPEPNIDGVKGWQDCFEGLLKKASE